MKPKTFNYQKYVDLQAKYEELQNKYDGVKAVKHHLAEMCNEKNKENKLLKAQIEKSKAKSVATLKTSD